MNCSICSEMYEKREDIHTGTFLKSLGFPKLTIHNSFNHFDFRRPARRILVIGPMGSGKTEYSARVWRDSKVARQKSEKVAGITTMEGADRRNVFFIRSLLDHSRFPDYPEDALAYRGGYELCGKNIAKIRDSFELEKVISDNSDAGTWIIDEASFYDERIAYIVKREAEQRGLIFIFPTLILNFRKGIFNSTARLIMETATDVFPLTAYCEHSDCIEDSFYTYRYYMVKGKECPALYFDPLILVGGTEKKSSPTQPNYCTRCDKHHYLPGKEYTFLILKPLGVIAARHDETPLEEELWNIKNNLKKSKLYIHFTEKYLETPAAINMNALDVPLIAEKALIFLFAEQNLIQENQLKGVVERLRLDRNYLSHVLADNGRPVEMEI